MSKVLDLNTSTHPLGEETLLLQCKVKAKGGTRRYLQRNEFLEGGTKSSTYRLPLFSLFIITTATGTKTAAESIAIRAILTKTLDIVPWRQKRCLGGALASRSNKSVKAGTVALARVGSLSRLRGSRSMLTQLFFSVISTAETFSLVLLLMSDMSARKAGSMS